MVTKWFSVSLQFCEDHTKMLAQHLISAVFY